jgi:hypothetical protein
VARPVDHIIWAAPDLDRAVDALETLSGIRARQGGSHPGRGTRNALMALGPSSYLEILAPDPMQDMAGTFGAQIRALDAPRLIGVMLASSELNEAKAIFAASGVACNGPFDAERRKPDGETLRWRLLIPQDPPWGDCTPMCIDWGTSPNPAASAPSGARLTRYEIGHPDGERLRALCSGLAAGVDVMRADRPYQLASVDGPKGAFTLTGFVR